MHSPKTAFWKALKVGTGSVKVTYSPQRLLRCFHVSSREAFVGEDNLVT